MSDAKIMNDVETSIPSSVQSTVTSATVIKNRLAGFTTKRLVITPFTEDDKALFCDLYTNDNIMRYLEPTLTTATAEKYFKTVIKNMNKASPVIIAWAITLKSSGEKIGIQTLSWTKWPQAETDPLFQTGEQPQVGIMLKETAQGKGYAKEAMSALIVYTQQHIPSVILDVFYFQKNVSSKLLFLNLGCKLDNNNQPRDLTIGHQYIKALCDPLKRS